MTAARPGRVRWQGLGPGIVFLLTAVGPGDLVSNVAAGATHGYALLWVLPVALVFRFVWLSTSARYVLVTGETLISGFARFGRGPLWLTLGALVVIRHMANLSKVVLLGSA
ncbi:MAG: Nramp family divalent metal transporter, partial [Vicinamibacterales bacterium]